MGVLCRNARLWLQQLDSQCSGTADFRCISSHYQNRMARLNSGAGVEPVRLGGDDTKAMLDDMQRKIEELERKKAELEKELSKL